MALTDSCGTGAAIAGVMGAAGGGGGAFRVRGKSRSVTDRG
uniref:Uncharacterized protein n=1 Tax=Candidatus Methanogaster sp. ANME-2c ERB4 TaxID=2759911 RepID=A0A7G9YKG3_9EURY|nr:hypothetical protein AFGHNAJH_00001 [Methanosarcinales archaeon ANME-2c ERB4]